MDIMKMENENIAVKNNKNNFGKDSLGDRMKLYELSFKNKLPQRLPIIIRLDGKAFHTYTKDCDKPFDSKFEEVMNLTAIELCKQIQGAQMAYVQSDEISILLHGYKSFDSQSWFDNEIQKMVSISAGIASATFTAHSEKIWWTNKKFREKAANKDGHIRMTEFTRPAYFDSRVFVVPENDVCNVFLWRMNDCVRNVVQSYAQNLFSHKQLHKKNVIELKKMLLEKGIIWEELPVSRIRGRCVIKEFYVKNNTKRSKWIIDNNIPDFKENRDYIDKYFKNEI